MAAAAALASGDGRALALHDFFRQHLHGCKVGEAGKKVARGRALKRAALLQQRAWGLGRRRALAATPEPTLMQWWCFTRHLPTVLMRRPRRAAASAGQAECTIDGLRVSGGAMVGQTGDTVLL